MYYKCSWRPQNRNGRSSISCACVFHRKKPSPKLTVRPLELRMFSRLETSLPDPNSRGNIFEGLIIQHI